MQDCHSTRRRGKHDLGHRGHRHPGLRGRRPALAESFERPAPPLVLRGNASQVVRAPLGLLLGLGKQHRSGRRGSRHVVNLGGCDLGHCHPDGLRANRPHLESHAGLADHDEVDVPGAQSYGQGHGHGHTLAHVGGDVAVLVVEPLEHLGNHVHPPACAGLGPQGRMGGPGLPALSANLFVMGSCHAHLWNDIHRGRRFWTAQHSDHGTLPRVGDVLRRCDGRHDASGLESPLGPRCGAGHGGEAGYDRGAGEGKEGKVRKHEGRADGFGHQDGHGRERLRGS
mmetsp:Transcript_19388/g.55596  ORF Transcript_19388/g.55596 Transcript_19388/m.55596 type:complete len:283 (+) Transcript_19388:267-1115(+)